MRFVQMLTIMTARLQSRTIEHYGAPYLTRYTLLRTPWLPFRLYLHRFHRPDADTEHHSHPWPMALAVILTGGYTEERMTDGGVHKLRHRPGSVVLLRRLTFHRVAALKHGPVWTLFIPFGRNSSEWYFRRADGSLIPWREFIKRQR